MPRAKPQKTDAVQIFVDVVPENEELLFQLDSPEEAAVVAAASSGSLQETDHLPRPKKNASVDTILKWIKNEAEILQKDQDILKIHLLHFMNTNSDFALFVLSNTQRTIAEKVGTDQGSISRIFGEVKAIKKEEIRQKVIKDIELGDKQKVVASKYNITERTVQNYIANKDDNTKKNGDHIISYDYERKAANYRLKSHEELVEILIKRDKTIGNMKKTIKGFYKDCELGED